MTSLLHTRRAPCPTGLLGAVAGLVSSVPTHALRAAALGAAAAALAAAARVCAQMRQNFIFQDYVHAHI